MENINYLQAIKRVIGMSDKPAWLGEEVTGDPRYFNSMLMKNPYKKLEIKVFKHIFLCLLTVSSLGACLKSEPVGGGGNGGGNPSGNAEYETGLEGLSALCPNETGDGIYVAEDNGHVYEFGLDGKWKRTLSFPAPYNACDWEGITLAPDGKIYLSEERTREIFQLSEDHTNVTLRSKGPFEPGSSENQGYEGIAAGDGVLYVANQSSPFRVYTFNLSSNTWTTAFDPTWGPESLSDIYYDRTDGTLWITDGNTQKLTQVKTDGTVLKTYDISFVKKPEGYCRDAAGNHWFVCDGTSILYKRSKL